MRLRSGKIIYMADELSNVNGSSSTNDSIPVSMQQADVSSRSEVNNMQNPQQYSEYSREYHVGSTSNAANSMVVYRQQVEESHHDLVNLLTQQMTTILNPMMADHESKFERLARQVKRIARIVDYDEGERHNARGNNEGMKNIFQNENYIPNRENPRLVHRNENADNVLHELRGDRYQVTRIVEEVLNRVGLNVVKIATMVLEFYMRRKLLNVHILDLAHLAEKVWQTELMKKEKEKHRTE
ncbi:hypothetical protein Ahy_A04g020359 [Arachis hypogaea]|uniref:Uncharacterized protein n=1 Tax=Arachis hypogaea TaxID=3818 RepID=A0A445DHR2_ARAHY|nr:hypothetical protein Ahy_A04g020359 [Arachis hypogaea]